MGFGEFVFSWAMGYLIGILIGALSIGNAIWAPDADYDFSVVCQYEGGTVQGDVCLKNERVLEINLED